MIRNDREPGQVWEEPDANRRAAVVLRSVLACAALMIVALGASMAVVVNDRVETTERNEELAFTALLSLAPRSELPALLEASGREAIVISPTDSTYLLTSRSTTSSVSFDRWRVRVRNQANVDDARQFQSTDPNGVTWWHTVVAFRSDERLVTSVRSSSGMALATELNGLVAAGTLVAVGIVGLLGLFLGRRLVNPVLALSAAGEELRVRGELRAATVADLQSIPQTPKELRSLSDAMMQIEGDGARAFREMDALLDAAGALGGSLDQETILNSTLDHLGHLLGIERSAILRHDLHANSFEVVAMRGHSDDYVRDLMQRRHDDSLPTVRALRDREPTQVSDTESEVVSSGLRLRARKHGYRSVLAVPLTDSLERPTVLVLHAAAPRSYSFDEIQLSKSFASIAGAALRNAELFSRTDADLQRQTSHLESIVESVDQGLLIEGTGGDLLHVNAPMRRLVSCSDVELSAMSLDTFVGEVLGTSMPEQYQALTTLKPGLDHWVDVELAVENNDVTRSYRVRSFLVRNAHGDTIGTGQTWSDISRDRELERMKSGLLAAVSHEFRTPLALIKGYATTLLADDVSWNADDQAEFLRMVSSEADRLTDLVQRILDMRRIDAGMVALQPMPLALHVLIDAVLDGLLHVRHRILVTQILDITVNVDAARLMTALRNVLENGCKYSPDEQPVQLTVELIDGEMHFLIRDHGPGIAEDLRGRIFDTFVRGDSGLAASHGGIGLGLAISKGFVEAHGGRMRIEDPPDGADGSVFRIVLPADAVGERQSGIDLPNAVQ